MIYGLVISEPVITAIGVKTDLMIHAKEVCFLGFNEQGKRRFECVISFYEGYQNYLDKEGPIQVPGVDKRFEFCCAIDFELTETEIHNEIAHYLAEVYTLASVNI